MIKSQKSRIMGIAIALILSIVFLLPGCAQQQKEKKIRVKVLILPKFEVGEISGDFPGEAQYFYEEYLAGGEEYEIIGSPESEKLYYKDGVAMFLLGQGKISAALSTAAVLSDERFDFSDAYIMCVGCGGAAKGYGVFGDVFVISAAVDFDLGHKADSREIKDRDGTTWFHDDSYDSIAVVRLDQSLTDRVFEKIKDLSLETTENTVAFLEKEYPEEAWADRPPQLMRGTSVTSDNYWKGIYDHRNAISITETYGCTDPYAVTEMEDVASARAVQSFGLLDRLIILRVGVNIDVFPKDLTPEMLWGEDSDDHVASEGSLESVDIFETAMKNCFGAGRILIDAMLDGTF